jgi:hypothetical protein
VYGSGGLTLAGAGLVALLREQARSARRKVEARTAKDDPPSGDGTYGRGRGKPIVFTVLGDSSAVGLGVERASETPGVLIAAALAELAERPVRLVRLAEQPMDDVRPDPRLITEEDHGRIHAGRPG